ncbi:type VII toxin-antitoxin system HepT family RNase toxin [Bacillus massilinigeriensis]|uniref:type VII toxin-antitoxin system HepT family RNase toxin n=1 Tax=Bacillus massilionigeriensis TaxID=1805475 RepID=UPI00096B2DD5|nr:DUF86 domain-containing protein [Bacillus massilionigeriensis]
MYFVDREKIENTLQFFEKQIVVFEEHTKWESLIEIAALERLTHTMIESILDVGNSMIDGFIMRDPGSYEDIVDILDDELVITKEMSESLKQIIKCRKMLVTDYIAIDHKELLSIFNNHLSKLKEFATSVRQYLENELGPVSAFRN